MVDLSRIETYLQDETTHLSSCSAISSQYLHITCQKHELPRKAAALFKNLSIYSFRRLLFRRSRQVVISIIGNDHIIFDPHTTNLPKPLEAFLVDVLAKLLVFEIRLDDEATEVDLISEISLKVHWGEWILRGLSLPLAQR